MWWYSTFYLIDDKAYLREFGVHPRLSEMSVDCFRSKMNFLDELTQSETINPNLTLNDVTLREGEQTSDCALSVEEKVAVARKLDEIGIKLIQGGHALNDKEALKAYKGAGVQARIEGYVLGFLPSWKEQVDAAMDADVDCLQTVFRTSDEHLKVLHMNRADMMTRAADVVEYAKGRGAEFVTFSASFASVADQSFLRDFCKSAVEAGARRICLNDTTGVLKPSAVKHWVHDIRNYTRASIEIHCHNDFGLAVANTLAGVEAGVEVADVSINGVGERAGNAPLEEVVMALKCLYNIDLRIRTQDFCSLSRMFQELTKMGIAHNKAVVGKFVFAQKLDAHVIATSVAPHLIEPFHPAIVGNRRRLIMGKYTGPVSVKTKLKELGLDVAEEKIGTIAERINQEAIRLKRGLTDEEFKEIVGESRHV